MRSTSTNYNLTIKELYISNIRSFSNLKISFNDGLNIFIGPNGVGKTTILEIINIFISKPFDFQYIFNENEEGFFCFKLSKVKITPKLLEHFDIKIEEQSIRINDLYEDICNLDTKKTIKSNCLEKEGHFLILFRKEDKDCYFIENNNLHKLYYFDHRLLLSPSLKFVPSPYSIKPQLQKIMESSKTMNKYFSKFKQKSTKLVNKENSDCGYRFKYISQPEMKLAILNQKGDEISKLSSGQQQYEYLNLFSMIADLSSKSTIIMDEPELHLNYGQLLYLNEVILKLKKLEYQTFIATHDSSIIKIVDNNSLKYLSFDERRKTRISDFIKLDFNIQDIAHYSDIFFCEGLVIVEGISDCIFLEKIVNCIAKDNKLMAFSQKNILFLSTNGKSSFKKIQKICTYIKLSHIFITDQDFVKNESDYSFISDSDIQQIKRLSKDIFKDKISYSLFRNLPKKQAKGFVDFLIKTIKKNGLITADKIKEFNEYKKRFTVNEVSTMKIFDRLKFNQLKKIFKKNLIWILGVGEIENYLTSDCLTKRGKLDVNKINEKFYPQNKKDLYQFIQQSKVSEFEDITKFINDQLRN